MIASISLVASVPAQASATAASGSLVIVGGGLRASNDAVFEEMIRLGRLREDGRIGIFPAASSRPVEYSRGFQEALVSRGVNPERIELLPLAVRDDPSTEFDESSWASNANDPATADRLRDLTAVWFLGGDQARIMQLMRPDGEADSLVFKATRALYQRGGVVGGTSAGAAIQSGIMILGGVSPDALRHGVTRTYLSTDEQESGPLILGDGVGFFPHGVIDQHFDRKARLGRLVIALMNNQDAVTHGYGIDEDTALVYHAETQTARVVGAATVVQVDVSEAVHADGAISGIRLSVLCPGDSVAWPSSEISVHPAKKATTGREYLSIKDPRAMGLFDPYSGRLEDALGFLLADNAAATSLDSLVRYPDGATRRLTFRKDERTRGFWAYLDGQRDSYTILDARLDIGPEQPAP